MADSFFGFETDLSALGAGKLEDFDTDFLEPADDEIDQLNDETFGAGAHDGDWEVEHEKLAEELGEKGRALLATKVYQSQEEALEQSISQLVVDDDDIDDPAVMNVSKGRAIPRRAQDLDELFGPASPPAFMDMETLVSPTSRNIWGSPARDSHITKPVNNIQTLFAYAKAAGKPPAFDIHEQAMMQAAAQHPAMTGTLPKAMTVEELEGKILGPTTNQHSAITAEELERQLRGETIHAQPPLKSHHEYHHQPVQEHSSPFSMPVPIPSGLLHGRRSPADLQQVPQVLGRSPLQRALDGRLSPTQVVPQGRMTPPMPGIVSPMSHHMSPMTHHVASNMSQHGAPMSHHNTPIHRGSPMALLDKLQYPTPVPSPPLNARHTIPPTCHHPAPPSCHHAIPRPLQQARMMSPYNHNSSVLGVLGKLGLASIAKALLREQINQSTHAAPAGQMIPNGMLRPMARGGHGQPPSPYGSPVGHSPYGSPVGLARMPMPMPMPMPQCDPSHMTRGRGMHPNNQFYPNQYNRSFQNTNAPRPRPHSNYVYRRGVDQYAGLMTQKEKDWIIKIQLMQLQTDDPYLDDFYYTTFTLKKKIRERHERERRQGLANTEEDPTLVLPALAKVDNKYYRPAQFEGSLGRLTTSSVHNPRQIIDLKPVVIPSDETEGQAKNISKDLRRFRQLLMDIEKCYLVILEIDDIEKKVLALPEESRKALFEERKDKINQLYQTMCCREKNEEIFSGVVTVRKGKKLLARILPLLEKGQALCMVEAVFRNLCTLVRKDQLDDSLPILCESLTDVIKSCDLETLVSMAEELHGRPSQTPHKTITIALQNKFVSTVIYTLLSQGEKIYSTTSPVDMDNQLQSTWSQFVQNVAEAIETLASSSLAKQRPSSSLQQEKVLKHFDRLLNRKLLASVEDKIKTLSTPVVEGTS